MKNFTKVFMAAALWLGSIGFLLAGGPVSGINYQAVIRDGSGNILTNHAATLKFSLHLNSPTGTVDFEETHALSTNTFGLVNTVIGTGTVVSGVWTSLNWANVYFLEVGADIGAGNVPLDTSQFEYVPYAFYSRLANTASFATTSGQWTNAGNNMYSANSGNVGIGTATPLYKLELASGSTAGLLKLTSTVSSTQITMDDSGPDDVYLSSTLGQFDIWTGGNNIRLSVATNGNVGIGNTTPTEKLTVNGTGSFSDHVAMSNGLDVTGTAAAYVINGTCTISNGNGVTGTASNGPSAYGVSGVSSSGWAGHFAGNLYYSGTLTGPSDVRLKENIQPLTNALSKVMQIEPSTYTFKKEYSKMNLAKGPQMGFIAQDMEKIFPDLVSTNYDKLMNPGTLFEFKSVNYIGMIPVLTKAIQELQHEIDLLKQQNAELMKKSDNK